MKKTVVITGATDGIGKALAILLSKEYNLALCGRSEDKMKQLTQELGDCHVYTECFDITDGEKRHSFCQQVIRKFGKTVVLVFAIIIGVVCFPATFFGVVLYIGLWLCLSSVVNPRLGIVLHTVRHIVELNENLWVGIKGVKNLLVNATLFARCGVHRDSEEQNTRLLGIEVGVDV